MANIFCKIKDIPGESSEKKDYFEVLSFGFGVSQHSSGAVGGTGAHVAGKPDFADIVVVKQVDKASAILALHCAQGKHPGEVLIEFYRNIGDAKPSKYLEYKLTNAIVRSVQVSGSDNSFAQETVQLGFAKLNWVYTQYDNTGKKVVDVKGEWDLEKNEGK